MTIPPKDPDERLRQNGISLPVGAWRWVDEQVKASGRSRSEVIRYLVEQAMKEDEAAKGKKK